jgi:DNA mismatch repair protein MutS2
VLSTGEVGGLRAHARAALDTIGASVEGAGTGDAGGGALDSPPAIGQRVLVPAFGTDGIVRGVSGKNVEVEIRGKRMRVRLTDLRAAGQAGGAAAERPGHLNARKAASREIRQPGAAGPVHLPSAELVLIGATVEDALARAEKFLDSALLADERRLRIVHGHGTGRLRDALRTHFREHALVASVSPAPDNEGGQGATIVELKD